MSRKSKISNSFRILLFLLLICEYIGKIFAQQPIPQPINTSNYNTIPKNGDFGDKRGNRLHEGIDIIAPAGTEVKATVDGKVIAAGTYGDGSYGNIVIIKDKDGKTITLDAHLKDKSITVKVGDEVKAGDKIGEVDNTGISDGDHLHHERRTINEGKDVKNYWQVFDKYKGKYINTTPYNPLSHLDPEGIIYIKKGKGSTGGAPPDTRPGWRPPDDTFSVADATFPTTPNLEDAYYRLAVKKGKTLVINYYWYKTLIKERDAYLENLPDSSIPDQAYLDSLEAEISRLYETFGSNQELFWKEYQETADVAVLQRGYPDGVENLLGRFQEPISQIFIDFSPQEVIKNHPVLIIPSGGLYGLQGSAMFKAALDEYVKSGGTLIVFTQPKGIHFSAIPTPDGEPIEAYGWDEDINCFFKGAYLNEYHQIVSSLTKSMPNINIDGHMTSIPDGAIHILTRSRNGQPILTVYEHGSGRVIVTTMYTDFAFGVSQAGPDEIAIVRDMIAWAKSPVELLEIRPGGTVSVVVTVENNTTTDAASVKLSLYDPDRKTLLSEQIIGQVIPAGQSNIIPVSYPSALTSPLGIYHIDYTLLDVSGNTIQPRAETDMGRFIVTSPPEVGYEGQGLTFDILTDKLSYLSGELATFTIRITNHTGIEKSVTAKYDGQEQRVTIVPKGVSSIIYTRMASTLNVSFYNEAGIFIGNTYRSPNIYSPSAKIESITPNKFLYFREETVTISTSIKNNIPLGWQSIVKTTVISPLYVKVLENINTVILPPSGKSSIEASFNLPATPVLGTYSVWVEVYDGARRVSLSSTRFEVVQSQISVQPDLPSVFNVGTNPISFTIKNTGKINVSSGLLDVSLKAPDGSIIYSGGQPFNIAVGESKTLDIPITIPSLEFGNYALAYTQSDETRTGRPSIVTLPNTMAITPAFDKPSYRVRETANLTATFTNTGKFNLENISLVVSAPDANYTDTQTISLGVTPIATSLNFTIPIPETISAGLHDVNVTLMLPGGSSKNSSTKFVVPQSSLSVSYQGSGSLTAGDTLNLILGNTGGVNTTYNAYINLTDQSGGHVDNKAVAGLAVAAGQELIFYTLPDQSQEGNYKLAVSVVDSKTMRTTYGYFSFNIIGLKGELTVRTNKEVYLSSETTTTLSAFSNQGRAITNGNLHLEIVCANPGLSSDIPTSFYIFTQENYNWVERGVLRFPHFFSLRELPLATTSDPWGNLFISIHQSGMDSAFIDYLALRDNNGNLYPPAFVGVVEWKDYTSEVLEEDGIVVDVTGQGFNAYWTNLPSGVPFSLVMVAREGEGCGVIWEQDVAINQGAGFAENYNISAGVLGRTGKFYLKGILTNALGQIIGTSSYPFYIIEGNTLLTLASDKNIYKPGETITITGRVENRAQIMAESLNLEVSSDGQIIYSALINLPSGQSYPYTITTTAGAEGEVVLSGKVSQNYSTLVEMSDQYEVIAPDLGLFLEAPAIAGKDSFSLDVTIENWERIEATIHLRITDNRGQIIDERQVTILSESTKLLQYNRQITQDTTYHIEITGDVTRAVTRAVAFGEAAQISLTSGTDRGTNIYPEGRVSVNAEVRNTGQLDEAIEVTYQLTSQVSQPIIITKTYYLPKGAYVNDTLCFDLIEGDYQITATSQRPTATAQANFSVRKENQVEMAVSLGTQTDGLIPVNVNLTNLGFNEISGSVNVSVTGGSGQVVWNGEETLSPLSPQSSQLITLNINPSAIEPGNYTLQAQLLNNSNQLIAVRSLEFGVRSANFQIIQLPPYQTFMAGEEATFVFRVRNTGDQGGSFDLRFKAYDLIDSTQREWLKPGEEKAVSFSFVLPDDLEEKNYFADYELKASAVAGVSKGQIKYHLAGISLNVNATLDKPYYTEGEIAHLTISIQSTNPTPQNFFARVNYAGFEPQQTFTLNGSQVLIFDVPLPQITGEKLFYGIYHESGRSIHLNSLYIHKAGDVITVTTDKQVYQPRDIVTVTVSGNTSGDMTLSGPGGYTETFTFTGSATKSFSLPATVTAGTYFINAQLSIPGSYLVTVVHPFDVAGIQVKVLECQNDKGKYASLDTIATSFTISSNTTMPAILKAWIVDPTGQYASVGEQTITLSSSENSLVTHQSSLITSVAGIHRLVYGIYGPEDLLLCSGSEAFDVGDAVLMGISTDKRDYPTNIEPVMVTASLFGSVGAELQLELDGAIIKTETISLNGFTTYSTELQNITPGPHTLKATLTAGGLRSTKETSFTYALAFMPRPQISASPAYLDFGGLNLGNTSTQTITLSSTGNANLVIGTIVLSGTNQGEFSIQNNSCSERTIAPSGNCTLDILFSPTSLGAKSASLFIPSNATEMPTLYLPLEGTGVTTLNVSINPMGGGRVTGTGIDCPGDCTESFSASGASIQLTATPTEGYRFINWTGDISASENPVTVDMATHKSVVAHFTINAYTINVSASLGGNITPSGLVTVNPGASQTFTITPDPGYHIVNVLVDGISVGAVTSYTLSNVTSNHTIVATFAINQYIIIATAGPNGIIIPSRPVVVNHGGNLTFTITPNTGYRILDVKVDGGSVGAVTTFTFNNVTSNHTIEATYAIENSPPVADAGPDQNVVTGQVVTLDGSESFDPEGAIITFLWAFVEVPSGSSVTNASLSDVTSAKPQFTTDVNGVYRLQLIVNNGALDSVPDEVVIHAATPNVAPNAEAGPDQNVHTGNPVQLDGSRSSDPDNGPLPLSYLWSFMVKPAGSLLTDSHIINRNLPNASFIPDVNGLYELRLTINDGHLSSEDTVQIIATLPNVPPNANAGSDMTIYLGNTAVLNGSASNDPDQGPQTLTYFWSFVAVPTGSRLTNGHISGANTVSPSFTPDVVGTYVLQLMVYDGKDAGFDNVAVTVLVDNIAPTLAPVPNKTILWPPNHKMVNITIWANASDNSGRPVVLSAIVRSNEPQDGLGDGDTSPDWTEPVIDQIRGIITLKLRAERSGRGNGRIYTITITARDASGNRSQANVEIRVPHSR